MGYRVHYNNLYHYNGYFTVYLGRFDEEHPIPSTCHLLLLANEQETLVIVTELCDNDNEGASVTNACEHLISQLVQEQHLDPRQIRFIEHYTDESFRSETSSKHPYEETYKEVTFTWQENQAYDPEWRQLQGEELEALRTIILESTPREQPARESE